MSKDKTVTPIHSLEESLAHRVGRMVRVAWTGRRTQRRARRTLDRPERRNAVDQATCRARRGTGDGGHGARHRADRRPAGVLCRGRPHRRRRGRVRRRAGPGPARLHRARRAGDRRGRRSGARRRYATGISVRPAGGDAGEPLRHPGGPARPGGRPLDRAADGAGVRRADRSGMLLVAEQYDAAASTPPARSIASATSTRPGVGPTSPTLAPLTMAAHKLAIERCGPPPATVEAFDTARLAAWASGDAAEGRAGVPREAPGPLHRVLRLAGTGSGSAGAAGTTNESVARRPALSPRSGRRGARRSSGRWPGRARCRRCWRESDESTCWKRPKIALELVERDAATVVGDGEEDVVAAALGGDLDGAAGRRELHRVADEVRQRLDDAVARRPRTVPASVSTASVDVRGDRRRHITSVALAMSCAASRGRSRRFTLGIEALEVEDVVDQPDEASVFCRRSAIIRCARPGNSSPTAPLGEQAERAADRGQRRAQLVADDGHELVLDALHLGAVRHVVEDGDRREVGVDDRGDRQVDGERRPVAAHHRLTDQLDVLASGDRGVDRRPAANGRRVRS